MVIEDRQDGRYIISTEKTDSGKTIVIKLDSEIETDLVLFHGPNARDVEISWKLKHDDEDGLHISLETCSSAFEKIIKTKVDEKCISELVSIVKNNGTLDDCYEINKAMNECYNILFREYLEEGYILCSSNIVDGIVEVNNTNKILGHGTRFIINRDSLTVCEYAGKEIIRDMSPRLHIYVNGTLIKYITKNIMFDRDRQVFSEDEDIGYLKYSGVIAGTSTGNCDISCKKLKMPFTFTDKINMLKYCIENNTSEEIIKYKIALKGKVKIINVNEYMVNEFLI